MLATWDAVNGNSSHVSTGFPWGSLQWWRTLWCVTWLTVIDARIARVVLEQLGLIILPRMSGQCQKRTFQEIQKLKKMIEGRTISFTKQIIAATASQPKNTRNTLVLCGSTRMSQANTRMQWTTTEVTCQIPMLTAGAYEAAIANFAFSLSLTHWHILKGSAWQNNAFWMI